MVKKQWTLEIPFLGVFIVMDSDGIPIGTTEVCASTQRSIAVVHCVMEPRASRGCFSAWLRARFS